MSILDDLKAKYPQAFETLEAHKNMSAESKLLLREDAIGYATTRKRQMLAAISQSDMEQVGTIVEDIAGVIGRKNAEWQPIAQMEMMVAASLKKQERGS